MHRRTRHLVQTWISEIFIISGEGVWLLTTVCQLEAF